jgi:thiol-disulfide isomerase/thioredoxin
MSKDLKVILVKADYCGHCRDFLPIYEKAIELAEESFSYAEFIIEEMDKRINPIAYENFKSKYGEEILSKIEGYPTVVLIFEKDGKKIDTQIDHTVGEKNEAAKRFLNNLNNKYNTLKSDSKKEFVSVNQQQGGDCKVNNVEYNDKYKVKYIKYKSKYLSLLKSSF